MPKPLCIIHANCQGDALHQLLRLTPDFSAMFDIEKYTNYLRENIPSESLERCALLLYQRLGDQWGEGATSALLQKLPLGAQALCIPNMFFNGYWPLWTNKTRMAYGDMLLEYLAGQGLSAKEILHVYLRGNLLSKYDMDALIDASRQKEESKEVGLIAETLDIIHDLWRKEQLFYTVNHPAPRLHLHVADAVLKGLGFGPVPQEARAAFAAQEEEFVQPIHPQVARRFDLPFATEDKLYPVYGQSMTFARYAEAYTACRLQDGPERIEDFVVYLHLLAQQQGSAHAA